MEINKISHRIQVRDLYAINDYDIANSALDLIILYFQQVRD